jgi:hypothetical protein
MNAEFAEYLDSHHDKYLYELLHKFELSLLGSTHLSTALKDEHLFLDVHFQFNHPIEIQVLSSEPTKQNEPISQNYFMVSRLSLQPQSI